MLFLFFIIYARWLIVNILLFYETILTTICFLNKNYHVRAKNLLSCFVVIKVIIFHANIKTIK